MGFHGRAQGLAPTFSRVGTGTRPYDCGLVMPWTTTEDFPCLDAPRMVKPLRLSAGIDEPFLIVEVADDRTGRATCDRANHRKSHSFVQAAINSSNFCAGHSAINCTPHIVHHYK